MTIVFNTFIRKLLFAAINIAVAYLAQWLAKTLVTLISKGAQKIVKTSEQKLITGKAE